LSAKAAAKLYWGTDVADLSALCQHLSTRQPSLLRVVGVPNQRLAGELAMLRALREGTDRSEDADRSVDPEAFHEQCGALGYRVWSTWSDVDDGCFDVVLASAS